MDDFEQELYTLAHEYGHAISFRKDQRPWKSAPPTTPDLAPETKQEVLEEEARAWRYGEEILRELGVDDLNAYVERQEKSIEEYRRRLGLV